MKQKQHLYLLLEDGTTLQGYSFGYHANTEGEVVFSTAMTGYPESLTDPSYRGQILTATYPLMGNYGVPDETRDKHKMYHYFESDKIQVKAFIVAGYCDAPFHWNMKETLGSWLKRNKVPGVCGIDTRALTEKLRERGVMLGKILTKKPSLKDTKEFFDPNITNLVSEVSVSKPIIYEPEKKGSKTVLVYDCGLKNNIVRNFLKRNVRVIRVPWDYDLKTSKYKFDGLFLSPGPGDPKMPEMIKNTVENIKYALKQKINIFGICLGAQLMALAIGANTYKLKYGHRSVNQPCVDVFTNRCYITSQNHGYAVDEKTLPGGWKVWMKNANDGTCEGIAHKSGKFKAVQFHPEASPGPTDTEYLFDEFVGQI